MVINVHLKLHLGFKVHKIKDCVTNIRSFGFTVNLANSDPIQR